MKEVKIELTEQCNRWCKHCSSKAKNTDFKSLDIDTVKRNVVATLNPTKSTEKAIPKTPPIIKLHVGKSAPPIISMPSSLI